MLDIEIKLFIQPSATNWRQLVITNKFSFLNLRMLIRRSESPAITAKKSKILVEARNRHLCLLVTGNWNIP